MAWCRLLSLEKAYMIYTSIPNSVFTRNYKLFCAMMEIPTGSGTKYRTPAESRTVAQFLLAVNTKRRAVFINFNIDLSVVVEPRGAEEDVLKDKYGNYSIRTKSELKQSLERLDISNSTFEGPSKMLKQRFIHNRGALEETLKGYSWQHPVRGLHALDLARGSDAITLSPEDLEVLFNGVPWESFRKAGKE